ncbi:MAG: cell division ATP-binding protein FtsE, partial [Sarcina sp.]
MIKFKNVNKIYENNVHALKNINLSIKKGEFVFLVGSSG